MEAGVVIRDICDIAIQMVEVVFPRYQALLLIDNARTQSYASYALLTEYEPKTRRRTKHYQLIKVDDIQGKQP